MVAQTKCPGCRKPVSHDHEHGRAARRRTYCLERCRRQAERTRAWNARHASTARRAIISRPEGGPSNPLKLLEDKSGNRGSRVGSSTSRCSTGNDGRSPARTVLGGEGELHSGRQEVVSAPRETTGNSFPVDTRVERPCPELCTPFGMPFSANFRQLRRPVVEQEEI
jgi:hypothetical protein